MEAGPCPAGDVYSLGVVLYELCAGHAPFTAEHPLALVRAHADDPAPRPVGMSDEMWSLLAALLSKDPDERPSAAELAVRLHQLAAALEPEAASLAPGTFAAGAAATRPIVEADGTELPDGELPDGEVRAAAVTSSGAPPHPNGAAADPNGAAPHPNGAASVLPRQERRGLVTYLVTAAAVVVVLAGAWLAFAPRLLSGEPSVVALGGATESVTGAAPIGTAAGPAPVTSTSPAIDTSPATGTQPSSPHARLPVAAAGPTSATAGGTPSPPVTLGRPDGSATPVVAPASKAIVETRPPAPTDPAPSTSTPADPRAGSVPLYRYYSAVSGDHFYTTDLNDLGNGKSGYVLEGVKAYVYPAARAGTVPLYRYFSAVSGDHFYTTDLERSRQQQERLHLRTRGRLRRPLIPDPRRGRCDRRVNEDAVGA